MSVSREERIERIVAVVSPMATGENLQKALAYVGKVLDAIDMLETAKKRRRDVLTQEELKDFIRWYSIYPRHEGRGQAEIKFKWAILRTDLPTLLTATKRYAEQVAGLERQWIRLPATWLSGKGWLDEYKLSPKSSTPANRRADLVDLARKGIITSDMTPDIVAEAKKA